MPIHVLIINEKDNVFVQIAPGRLSKDGVTRKIQKAHKGFTCFFDSMKILQADAYSNISPETRAIIKSASKIVETLSVKYATIIGSINLLNSDKRTNIHVTDKNIDRLTNFYMERLMHTTSEQEKSENQIVCNFFNNFKNRTKKSLSALEFAQTMQLIEQKLHYTTVMKDLNIVPDEYYQKLYPNIVKEIPWSQVDLKSQVVFMLNFIHKACYDLYGLHESDWHPDTHHFHDLLDVLRTKGAVIATGAFYQAFDENSKFTHNQLAYDLVHSIIIVGGRKQNNKPILCYIDPMDESPVNQERKIYTIDYDEFIKKLCNLQGISNINNERNILLYDSAFKPC